MICAEEVSWRRGGNLVVDGVTLSPRQGEMVGLLGPNGCGKSSLLTLLYAAARPTAGRVLLNDAPMEEVPSKQRARQVAVVTQHAQTDLAVRVVDVVRLGRIPHRGAFGGDPVRDVAAVRAALEATGLTELANREWHHLSGGERQRVQIARALAQEPSELLLDEPTNHLDIKHQLEVLRLVSGLGVTAVVALHDLNLAAAYCDSLLVLKSGRVVAAGAPSDVLTAELIRDVYGVEARVRMDEELGRLTVTYLA